MEILTASGQVYGNSCSGVQTAVDIKQIVANTVAYQPTADGQSANPPPAEKAADWAKLAEDRAAQSPLNDLPLKEQTGRRKKRPGLEGEAGQVSPGAMPAEDTAAPRTGKSVSRLRHNVSLRGAGPDARSALPEAEGKAGTRRDALWPTRVKADTLHDASPPPGVKADGLKLADLSDTAALGADESDQEPFNDLVPAGVPVNSRPAGEFLPPPLKAPDPLPNERQPTAPQFASEMKNTGGGTLLYTFNKSKTLSSDAMAVNQVQISFQGSTVLTPSNRTTQENLLANQSEAQGYLVKPASDREQRQRQRQHDGDGHAGEDQ